MAPFSRTSGHHRVRLHFWDWDCNGPEPDTLRTGIGLVGTPAMALARIGWVAPWSPACERPLQGPYERHGGSLGWGGLQPAGLQHCLATHAGSSPGVASGTCHTTCGTPGAGTWAGNGDDKIMHGCVHGSRSCGRVGDCKGGPMGNGLDGCRLPFCDGTGHEATGASADGVVRTLAERLDYNTPFALLVGASGVTNLPLLRHRLRRGRTLFLCSHMCRHRRRSNAPAWHRRTHNS